MYKVEIQITLSTVLLLVLTQHRLAREGGKGGGGHAWAACRGLPRTAGMRPGREPLPSAPVSCRWSSDTRLFWSECYLLPCRAAVSMGERFVYCLELGYYVQASPGPRGWEGAWDEGGQLAGLCLAAAGGAWGRAASRTSTAASLAAQAIPVLFLWETKRKDRLETFAHHVATIALIGYSYYLKCGGWRWGGCVRGGQPHWSRCWLVGTGAAAWLGVGSSPGVASQRHPPSGHGDSPGRPRPRMQSDPCGRHGAHLPRDERHLPRSGQDGALRGV